MKSVKITSRLFVVTAVLLTLVGCGSSSKAPNTYRDQNTDRPLVDSKYSLAADRQQLDELRAQVPEDRRQQNDELALILNMVSDTKTELKTPPSEIRSRFDSMLRKKREIFDRDMKKERETFTQAERKKREAFLKDQQENRGAFNREKQTRERKNEFFKELDGKRTDYFSVERERRADFESDVRERRKSFEDYTRSTSNQFNQELRAYQKRYDDAKKQREVQVKTGTYSQHQLSEAAALEKELEEIKGKRGTSLESGE